MPPWQAAPLETTAGVVSAKPAPAVVKERSMRSRMLRTISAFSDVKFLCDVSAMYRATSCGSRRVRLLIPIEAIMPNLSDTIVVSDSI